MAVAFAFPLSLANIVCDSATPQVEEEDFARACINAFSSGMLSEVEDGTTLRAFLASRLHCQPMRGVDVVMPSVAVSSCRSIVGAMEGYGVEAALATALFLQRLQFTPEKVEFGSQGSRSPKIPISAAVLPCTILPRTTTTIAQNFQIQLTSSI